MNIPKVPSVRDGCGQCDNCKYLKFFRPEIVTSMIAPDCHVEVLSNWEKIQAGRPCTTPTTGPAAMGGFR